MSAKQVEVVLSNPIQYSKDGDYHQESVITMQAPSLESEKAKRNARRLRDLGKRGLMQVQKLSDGQPQDADDKAADNLTGQDYMSMYSLGGVDTDELTEAMKLLAPAVLKIGEDNPFKEAHWAKLSMEDQDEITGSYLFNFLLNLGDSKT